MQYLVFEEVFLSKLSSNCISYVLLIEASNFSKR